MKADYTTIARRYYLRHPLLADIGTQINFWIIAYALFFIILYFISKAITSLYQAPVEISLWENIFFAIVAAVVLGTALGLIDFFVEKTLRGKSLGVEILVKGISYLLAWYFVGSVSYLIGKYFDAKIVDSPILRHTEIFSGNLYYAGTIYTAAMIIIISFIKQMNAKFGPGILIPMMLGKYRNPSIENRIFLFMDLKDSTSYAEKLGNLKFSQMIQDCFIDVNRVIPPFNAEIYQYVGDEVVLSWRDEEGLRNLNCIKFLFSFREYLRSRSDYYENKYGLVPQFKAGANIGNVTVAEVGDFKREIAYHGDAINTAARIQGVCNTYNKHFIISGQLSAKLKWTSEFKTEFLDTIKLKGKAEEVKLFSVTKAELTF